MRAIIQIIVGAMMLFAGLTLAGLIIAEVTEHEPVDPFPAWHAAALAELSEARSSWKFYGDPRLPDETRVYAAAVKFLQINLDGAPTHLNVEFEIAPSVAELQRILENDLYETYKKQRRVYAYANHYVGSRHVVTMMASALDFDWRARSVIVHELEHVKMHAMNIESSTTCGLLAHEIRATQAEMNQYEITGVPLNGKGLTFRGGNATLLKRYNDRYLTNHCNGR